jgi:hypothetical protein
MFTKLRIKFCERKIKQLEELICKTQEQIEFLNSKMKYYDDYFSEEKGFIRYCLDQYAFDLFNEKQKLRYLTKNLDTKHTEK